MPRYRELSLPEGLLRVTTDDGPAQCGKQPPRGLGPFSLVSSPASIPSSLGQIGRRALAGRPHRPLVSHPGPAALFTGVAPTIVGYGAEGALKFGAYESLKPVAAGALEALGLATEQAASLGPLGSAVVAGGLASLVLAPAEATRIRMVSDSTYADLGLRGSMHKVTRPCLAWLAAALAPHHRSRGALACSRLPSRRPR